MKTNVLFCWLGKTDLDASTGVDAVGLGPVAQAVAQAIEARSYDEVVLLNNWEQAKAKSYVAWLKEKTASKIILHQIKLSGPTNYREIYQAATKAISEKLEEYGPDTNLAYHLSPGTPAMAAIWVLLAKTKFPAKLIESSKEQGVCPVEIPFDISADFIPDLLRRQDKTIAGLAAGLTIEAPEFDDIIHRSEVMQRVVLMARRVASRSITVLIEGESGTGKELFARAIHKASPRKGKAFVAINCAAIPPELVESELFGHKKGAFTGATTDRKGHFEEAGQGTIFLDEIGELPKEIQAKLLRTIQEGEVKRVGADQPRKVDVRIIAATNKILIDEVAAGSFREDLFYRLAVAVIKLPPLRERAGDVSLLIDQFMGRINQESRNEPGYKRKKISASARNLLLRHPWPGNVRELQNTLTRAAVWSVDEELGEEDILAALLPVPAAAKGEDQILNQQLSEQFNLPDLMKQVAVHYLERGLAESHGNKAKASRILGFPNPTTFTNWLKKTGLE